MTNRENTNDKITHGSVNPEGTNHEGTNHDLDRPLLGLPDSGGPVLAYTLGLQGSGKSTYAKALVASAPTQWTRVNKDDLRAMLHNGISHKSNEPQVIRVRDAIIRDALRSGRSVIVDDTNFAPFHLKRFAELASQCGAELVCVDFTDVAVETCAARDAARANPIGERAIRSTAERYILP